MKKRLNKLFIKDESGHYKYVYGQKEIAKYTNVDYKLSKILIVFYSFVLFCICFGLYFLYLDRHDFYILKDSITVDSGSIYQLSILPKNSKYFSYSDYVFSIKDNKIAKIDQNGTIYALKNGKTKVSVRYKNSFIHKKVTLIVDNVNVREIAFNDKDIVVYRNESIKLKPNINNREDIVTTLNYVSSDPSVLTVDNFGNVTALKVGSAKIIVESSDGTKAETTIKVEGNNKSIVGLSIKEKDVRINPYETKQLTLVTLPSGSSEDVTWTSSNPKVVSVDNNGLIKGLSSGYSIIKVTTKSGVNAETVVSVNDGVDIIKLSDSTKSLINGEEYKLNVISLSNDIISWSSSDSSVASVDNEGNIKALSYGSTTIKATLPSGISAICLVDVVDKTINVESIEINKSEVSIYAGDYIILSANVNPSNATDKTIIWSSSNNKIVSVDNGIVKGINAGSANITAETSNGKKSVCKIIVKGKTIESISFENKTIELELNKEIKINPIVTPSGINETKLTWASSNDKIVSVDNSGNIKGNKVGEANITVKTANNKIADIKVIVKENDIPAKSISLDVNNKTIKVDDSFNIKAILLPSNTTIKTVVWTSSNPGVAKVVNGHVVGISEGQATITAQTGNGLNAKCNVVVEPAYREVESINILSMNSIRIEVGDSKKIGVSIYPFNATNKELTWSSSDDSIFTVNNGTITAKKAGSANLIVKSNNGKMDTQRVIVNNKPIEVESITLNKTSISINKGETASLISTINPSNATDQSVTWTTSDKNVVRVNNGVISGIGSGNATITAKSKNGKTVSCKVTVVNKNIDVEGISLNTTQASLVVDNKIDLVATIIPSGASDKSVAWSSSNNKVAKVDSKGKVKALSPGKATITAKSINGKTATCEIEVKESVVDVKKLVLRVSSTNLYVGNEMNMVAIIEPSNATDQRVYFESSNPKVATVDSSGHVKAVGVGSATISATSASSKLVAKSTIVVIKKPIETESISLSSERIEIFKGESVYLKAFVKPNDASEKRVSWTTYNNRVALVSPDGKVTGMGVGTTTIEVSTNNNKKASCTVVVKPIIPTEMKLNKSSLKLKVNSSERIIATMSPDNTTDDRIQCISEDMDIAVADYDCNITGLQKGKTKINVMSVSNTNLNSTVTVTVE